MTFDELAKLLGIIFPVLGVIAVGVLGVFQVRNKNAGDAIKSISEASIQISKRLTEMEVESAEDRSKIRKLERLTSAQEDEIRELHEEIRQKDRTIRRLSDRIAVLEHENHRLRESDASEPPVASPD